MINLVQNSADLVHGYAGIYAAHVGLLRTPFSGNRVEVALEYGMVWAMDNGCYKRYDPAAIIRMMERFRGLPNCKFMVAPDVVEDHEATLLMFRAWLGTIQSFGYPVAFVLQDGVTFESVPWDSIQAIFIGGSTKFKYSEVVRRIVAEAKRRGLHVHMGRVNSKDRSTYAKSIGCDSTDGTSSSIAPKETIQLLAPVFAADRQMNLWELENAA